MYAGPIFNDTNKYSFISAFSNDKKLHILSDIYFKTVKVYINIQSPLKYNSRPLDSPFQHGSPFKTDFLSYFSRMPFSRFLNTSVLLSMLLRHKKVTLQITDAQQNQHNHKLIN